MHAKPLIAVTMGDPAGIGPETIVGAWSHPAAHDCSQPFVVGHPDVMRRAIALLDANIRLQEITRPDEAESTAEVMPCLKSCGDAATEVPAGEVDARGGQAAYEALMAAAWLALTHQVDALVTAPLSKTALWKAGHEYPGHTEVLARLCGVTDYAMMLYLGPGGEVHGSAGLAIAHVTLHMAMRDAIAMLKSDDILAKARLLHDVMHDLKGSRPKIGVCALNPHAGEDGIFGDEETRIIRPAVDRGLAEGLDLAGPLPADTLIARARDGQFDAVAMYHDQGHIAIKLLAMHRAVNVTLGLPIVRTSVAHGTAFDVAWKGRAETAGMVEAIRVASRLAGVKMQRAGV